MYLMKLIIILIFDMAAREWKKGITVDVFDEIDNNININPLFNLESYKFVKDVIEMEKIQNDNENNDFDSDSEDNILCIEIPQEYLIRDIIYLLKYLKDLDHNNEENNDVVIDENKDNYSDNIVMKNEKNNENNNENKIEIEHIPFVFGSVNESEKEMLETNVSEIENNNAEMNENIKIIKKDKKSKRRGKRVRGGRKRNKNKNKKNKNDNINNGKKLKKKKEK
eukprot:127116_1